MNLINLEKFSPQRILHETLAWVLLPHAHCINSQDETRLCW